MSDTAKSKLTQPQREILVKAADHTGQVSQFGVMRKTLESLMTQGYVVVDYVVRSETEREELTTQLNTWVDKASAILNGQEYVSGVKWENALRCLQFAADNRDRLKAKAYWITDAGRKAVR